MKLLKKVINRITPDRWKGTADYWEDRYAAGGNSGTGSYHKLAEFKADFLNRLVEEEGIHSVIEFGCGDGNQLTLAKYPSYVGLDVSHTAIKRCSRLFDNDASKSFFLYDSLAFQDHHQLFVADLAMSLDVIYHLVEEDVYQNYLDHLFSSGERIVVIYSGDEENVPGKKDLHVRPRKFSGDVSRKYKEWQLVKQVKNQYPLEEFGPDLGSFADFYVYRKIGK